MNETFDFDLKVPVQKTPVQLLLNPLQPFAKLFQVVNHFQLGLGWFCFVFSNPILLHFSAQALDRNCTLEC